MKTCTSIVGLRRQLLAILLVGIAACQAKADLNQITIRSVEWLVDNSDTIAVYRMHDHASSDAPTLLRTIKGDAGDISHPLNPPSYDDYRYFKAHGPMRLLFVRNGKELLHDIDLDREQILAGFPRLTRVVYGVTHFGELLLSEASLFRVITDRINSGPGTPLPPDSSWAHAEISGIVAPHDFPLETNSRTYVLVVPFTKERRDHFIRVLREGDAAERIRAVLELRHFDDPVATSALRAATDPQSASPTFRYHQGSEIILTGEDVARAAKHALEAAR